MDPSVCIWAAVHSRWEAVGSLLALVKDDKSQLQVAEKQHEATCSTQTSAAPFSLRCDAELQSIDSHAGCLHAAGQQVLGRELTS